ncbi:unnamed protein product [Didymodactylos carnosus]|uniref:Uncharacterized protein n=1 Tax=Didymodactylos carnosus TaxID=1234261 RepID=A0A8S2QU28_9BILA|nr:unnamed protein product [Didymodactylos carnosus]CAF4126229.1 unnamed protein product [Didymodactylos carnosus]
MSPSKNFQKPAYPKRTSRCFAEGSNEHLTYESIKNLDEQSEQQEQKPNKIALISHSLVKNQKKSPFYAKQLETGNKIELTEWHVISSDIRPKRLLIKESIAIKSLQPSLNRTVASAPLYVYPEGLPKYFIPDPGGYRQSSSPFL